MRHMFSLGLTLGLGMTIMPLASADAARSDVRGSQSSSRQSSHQLSVRGGFSAMPSARRSGSHRQSSHSQGGRRGSYAYSAGISCVPYARSVTGMEISGNGRDWWHNAAGRYARSSRPEPGSILSFPSSGAMRSGHVAVVSRVVNSRLIEIDHANWGGPGISRGSVMQGVDVIDVSSSNDWTQVRVQVGHSNAQFGREYPTHGFILNRPDQGGAGVSYASYSPGASSPSSDQPASIHGSSRSASRSASHAPARHSLLVRVSHQAPRRR